MTECYQTCQAASDSSQTRETIGTVIYTTSGTSQASEIYNKIRL